MRPLDDARGPGHATHGIAIGVIATPATVAQEICDRLVGAGVSSILNFAPVVLVVPDEVEVRKVDMSIELQILAFHEQRKLAPGEIRDAVARELEAAANVSVLVVGLSHRTAPVALLEKAALAGDAAGQAARRRRRHPSTPPRRSCSRPATGSRSTPTSTSSTVASPICPSCSPACRGAASTSLTPHLYVHYEDRAVAAPVLRGLRARLDGRRREPDPRAGQARAARSRRTRARPRGLLSGLVQQALRVGKRARTETGIDQAGRSLVTAGLGEAAATLGTLSGRRCSSSAPGSMSALAATVRRPVGRRTVVVANRTLDHAQRLAASVGGRAIELAAMLEEALVDGRPRDLLHRRRRPRRSSAERRGGRAASAERPATGAARPGSAA